MRIPAQSEEPLALGALAPAEHIRQYFVDACSSVPTIGTLFLVNFASATVVGIALLVPQVRRVRAAIASEAAATLLLSAFLVAQRR